MHAKIDPKVVIGLSMIKVVGWNNLHPSNQKLLGQIMDENEPLMLTGISNRDPTFCGTTF